MITLGAIGIIAPRASVAEAGVIMPTASVDGTALTIGEYGDDEYSGAVLPSDFVVEVNNNPDTVTSSILANYNPGMDEYGTVRLTLSSAVVSGDTVTLSYNGTDLQYDADGCEDFVSMPPFSDDSVTNDTPSSTVPSLSDATISPGADNGNTKVVTIVPDGDTLVYTIGSMSTSAPDTGTSPPPTAVEYSSGNDIPVSSGKYLDVYEENSGGQTVAFEEFSITSSDILENAATPSITTQPEAAQSVTVEGANPTLNVTASASDSGMLSYQWYSNTSNSTSGGTKINGATSATYSAPTSTVGTTYYYCIVTNTNNDVTGVNTANTTSSLAKVTVNALVNAATPSISAQPADQTVNKGSSASLNVTASVDDGGTLSYQWYSNTTDSTSGGTQITGATSATYAVPTTGLGSTYYYCVITNTNNSVNGDTTATATTSAAEVTVKPVPSSGPSSPFINTISFMEDAKVGSPYSAQLVTTGGTQPFNWSVINGALPQGLTLSNQGVISGTPTGAGGQYIFTVKVTDANNLSATRQLTLTVDGPMSVPAVSTASIVPDKIGQSYDQVLDATGGTAPYTWRAASGMLPTGLNLNAQTGTISGTPTKGGISHITVEVTDANGQTATQAVTVDILQSYEREVIWNGQVKNIPAIVGNDGGTQTTYMPIWYVKQFLNSMGIQSTWNGHDWDMNTSSTPDLSNIQAGTGSAGIYLNGTLVQKVNTQAKIDPSTNKPTTYMPIWYVRQLLDRVGLQSNWNGTTWSVTQQNN